MVWIGYESAIEDNKSAILDHQIRFLISEQIHDVLVKTESANTPRTLELLRTQQNVCVSGMYNTETRETFTYATKLPSSLFPEAKVYVRKEKLPLLNIDSKHVSLEHLMTTRGIVFGANLGRSYGKTLDNLLNKNRDKVPISIGDSVQNQLLDLVLIGRIDAFIEHHGVIDNYYEVNQPDSDLVELIISETTQYTPVYFMCSRTQIGKELVNKVNNALAKLSQNIDWFFLQVQALGLEDTDISNFIDAYNTTYDTGFTVGDLRYGGLDGRK